MTEQPIPSDSGPPKLRSIPWYEGMDQLDSVFSLQRQLMAKYNQIEESNYSPVIPEELEGRLDHRKVQARIHQLFAFLVQELGEAMQELNKPWKQTARETDQEAFYGELGDCLHFFVELCITAGMTSEDLHRAYFRMHNKNVQRQSTNY